MHSHRKEAHEQHYSQQQNHKADLAIALEFERLMRTA
jgi:hypothetical protein